MLSNNGFIFYFLSLLLANASPNIPSHAISSNIGIST